MKKKIFLITLSLFLITGCGKIPKLKNGEEAVVTFKNGDKISANEVYNTMKKDYSLDATLSLIDQKILEKEFKKDVKDAKKYAEDTIKSMKESYGNDDKLLEAIRMYTGFSNIDAYKNFLYINYLQNKAAEQYAKDLVSNNSIENYYKDIYFGDVSIDHILITSSVKSGATDEEKKAAEKEAKAKAEEVIKKLDEAKKNKKDIKEEFAKLAKEYSKDDKTKNDGGKLGYINLNQLGSNYDELINAATKLKDGEYSSKVITTDLGYHVILKEGQKKKASLEDVKDTIRETLAQSTLSSDAQINAKAMKHYRDEYGVSIIDSDIKKEYEAYIKDATTAKEQNTNK